MNAKAAAETRKTAMCSMFASGLPVSGYSLPFSFFFLLHFQSS